VSEEALGDVTRSWSSERFENPHWSSSLIGTSPVLDDSFSSTVEDSSSRLADDDHQRPPKQSLVVGIRVEKIVSPRRPRPREAE
jgi:hypothetical protein